MSEARASPLDRWLRPGREGPGEIRLDLLWLLGIGLLFIGAGLGLRDPWPADEPRFVLIAQDMLRSGDWLVPRVGGDLYADKPPLFFGLLAASPDLPDKVRAAVSAYTATHQQWLAADVQRIEKSCAIEKEHPEGRPGDRSNHSDPGDPGDGTRPTQHASGERKPGNNIHGGIGDPQFLEPGNAPGGRLNIIEQGKKQQRFSHLHQ